MAGTDWDDPAEFFDEDEGAVRARFTLADGSELEVVGIYRDPGMAARLGGYSADAVAPTFSAPAVSLARVGARDLAVIDGRHFDVLEAPHGDGGGLAMVVLARA